MNPLSSFTWSTHQRIFSRYFLGSGTHWWVGSRSCPQRTGIRLGKGDAGNSESVYLARGEETEPSSLKSSRVALSHRRVCVCLCWESEAFVPGDQEGEGFEAEVGKTQKGWRCLKPHYPKYGLWISRTSRILDSSQTDQIRLCILTGCPSDLSHITVWEALVSNTLKHVM